MHAGARRAGPVAGVGEHKQRRTAGRQCEPVDGGAQRGAGEASQTLTHRNSTMRDAAAPTTLSVTMRDAAAPTMLSVAAEQLSSARTVLPGRWPSSSTPMVVASELRPSGSPAALAELRHARGGGGGGRAQTAWVPATLAELWHCWPCPHSHTRDQLAGVGDNTQDLPATNAAEHKLLYLGLY